MDGTTAIVTATEQQLRIDLAAAFRIAARYEWTEAVANHFSLAVSGDGKTFLLNPLCWIRGRKPCRRGLIQRPG